MKKKNVLSFLTIVCIILGMLTGCGKDENRVAEQLKPVESEKESVTIEEKIDGKILFEKISDREFWFGSGAGAWCTVLRVDKDGNFKGNYHDSNLGDAGDDYPNGTCYWSDFSGKFTIPKKINDYTWSVKVESIEVANEPGTEAIIDDIKYIYSEPYGLDNAGEILFYEPGAPVERLPESYINWMTIYDEFEDGKLPFYGIYNVNAEEGFSSYEIEEEDVVQTEPEKEPETELEGIEAELDVLNRQAEELENRLDADETISQSEKDEISAELYKLWDDKLNELWGRLKKILDKDAMSALTKEEIKWIDDKKAELEKLAKEYEGDSVCDMVCNLRGAEVTKERVYELAEYFK